MTLRDTYMMSMDTNTMYIATNTTPMDTNTTAMGIMFVQEGKKGVTREINQWHTPGVEFDNQVL